MLTRDHPFLDLRWAAEYLSRTETFNAASFLHVIGISEKGEGWTGTDARALLDGKVGSYRLVGRTRLTRRKGGQLPLGRWSHVFLYILQRQRSEGDTTSTYRVDTNSETISVIGEETFTITSPYERVVVPLQVLEPTTPRRRKPSITIEAVGSQGPAVRIPVVVDPSAGGAGATGAGGLGVFLVGLAGYTANITTGQKYLFAVGSAIGPSF